MATQLSIINGAFAKLGEPVVRDLGGDPKPPNVVKALAAWDDALDVALSNDGWLCALEAYELTPMASGGDWKYPYYFGLPAGTLRVWSHLAGDAFAWEAGAVHETGGAVRKVIKAGEAGPLRVELIMRRPAEALTPLLADALAWELAARLAGPIQSNEKKAQWADGKAEAAYLRASSAEATQFGGQPVAHGSILAEARRSAL